MSATRPYEPSNGTEGHMFTEAWCGNCRKLNNCMIELAAMMNSIGDPDYPKQWVYVDGEPTCTAFDDANKPRPKPRCKLTEDMFGGTA